MVWAGQLLAPGKVGEELPCEVKCADPGFLRRPEGLFEGQILCPHKEKLSN